MAADALRVSRKRSLEDFGDDLDCQPLSKRLLSMFLKEGALQVTKKDQFVVGSEASTSAQHSEETATDPQANDQQNIQAHDRQQLQYDPDLTSDQNPHYYESNRLLFDLYVERVQRHGQ